MFDTILKLIELVLGRLPGLSYGGDRKRVFAKSLVKLHSQLLKICENGDEIFNQLDEYRRTELLDELKLESLLSNQEGLISEVAELVNSYKYVDLLNIKIPNLFPMQVIEEKKGSLADIRVWLAFWLSPRSLSVGPSKRGAHCLLKEYRNDGYPLRAPSKAHAQIGRELIIKIRDNCEQLRKFLDRTFTVDELL